MLLLPLVEAPHFPVPFVVASLAAHAVVVTALGHAPLGASSTPAAPSDPMLIVDVLLLAREQETAPSPPPVATESRTVAPASHKHAYPVPADHDARPHDPSLVHLPLRAEPAAQQPSAEDAPASPVVSAPAAPHFTMALSNTSTVPGASSASAGGDQAHEGEIARGGDGAPLPETSVSSPAHVLGAVTLAYPAEARAQGVEADVVLALVVSAQGVVREAQVAKPAGFGFDDAALRAVRAARFEPARRDGRPVAVRMRWTVSFRLR